MIKNKSFFNVIKISSLFIAATIGAGFASGKELFIYFTQYQENSEISIALSGVLFLMVGFLFFHFIRRNKPQNIDDFFHILLNNKVASLLSFLVIVFMLGVLSIMISGMSNIIVALTGFTYFYCTIFVTLLCIGILIKGIKGIVFISQFITPILILGIFILCTLFLQDTTLLPVSSGKQLYVHWSVSSLMYIAYNIIISTVVIIDVQYLMCSKKVIFLSSLLGSLGLYITSHLINKVLTKYYTLVAHEDLPMLSLAKHFNPFIFYVWSAILFFAMLSTALSSAMGCLDYIHAKIVLDTKIMVFLFFSITLPLTYMGFSKLILFFYPLFGIIGLLLILFVLIKTIKT
ncbi:MAG: hypothetical protein ACOWWR_03460 [Eubacteriales bacterium]